MIQSYKLCKAMCAGLVILALFSALPSLAATQTVTNTLDAGAGSLRRAILDAAMGDEIIFTLDFSTPQTITLTSGELVISKDLTIRGPGAEELAISGNHASRVFRITGSSTVVSISGVTIRDGATINYSCCYPIIAGGGISIEGGSTVTVTNSTVSGNSAPYDFGGGINNYYSTLTVSNSTVTNNSARWGGGGIMNYWYGTLTVTNSTVSGNSATEGPGGGIYNYSSTLTLTKSTPWAIRVPVVVASPTSAH